MASGFHVYCVLASQYGVVYCNLCVVYHFFPKSYHKKKHTTFFSNVHVRPLTATVRTGKFGAQTFTLKVTSVSSQHGVIPTKAAPSPNFVIYFAFFFALWHKSSFLFLYLHLDPTTLNTPHILYLASTTHFPSLTHTSFLILLEVSCMDLHPLVVSSREFQLFGHFGKNHTKPNPNFHLFFIRLEDY